MVVTASSQDLEAQSLLRSYYALPLMFAVLENSLLPYHNMNLHEKHMIGKVTTWSTKIRIQEK